MLLTALNRTDRSKPVDYERRKAVIVNIVERLLSGLVRYPHWLSVKTSNLEGDAFSFTVQCAEPDMGRINGRSGKTYSALKTIAEALGQAAGLRVFYGRHEEPLDLRGSALGQAKARTSMPLIFGIVAAICGEILGPGCSPSMRPIPGDKGAVISVDTKELGWNDDLWKAVALVVAAIGREAGKEVVLEVV